MIWVIRLVGRAALKREAMGFGDVVLMAMVGAFLGWQPTVIAILIAAILSVVLVLATRLFAWNREIPFGPFLSLGTLITLLGWKWIWIRFEPLFSNPVFLGASALFLPVGMFVLLLLVRASDDFLAFRQMTTNLAMENGPRPIICFTSPAKPLIDNKANGDAIRGRANPPAEVNQTGNSGEGRAEWDTIASPHNGDHHASNGFAFRELRRRLAGAGSVELGRLSDPRVVVGLRGRDAHGQAAASVGTRL